MLTPRLQKLIERWSEIASDHRNAERSSRGFELESETKYHRDQAKRLEACIAELRLALKEREAA